MKLEQLNRLGFILTKLNQRPYSREELQEAYERETGQAVSERTFFRDMQGLKEYFGVEIEQIKSEGRYELTNKDSVRQSYLQELIDAYNLYHVFQLTKNTEQILLPGNPKPKHTDKLRYIVDAILDNSMVTFNYQKNNETKYTERKVAPYVLKEFDNRWYLIGEDAKDKKIKTFGLDRVSDIETVGSFKAPKNFNAKEMFQHRFGILPPESETAQPEEIILECTRTHGNYINGTPLHESQEPLERNENTITFKYKLYITHDFVMQLLSYGCDVKVIQPESLANRVKELHKRAFELYQ